MKASVSHNFALWLLVTLASWHLTFFFLVIYCYHIKWFSSLLILGNFIQPSHFVSGLEDVSPLILLTTKMRFGGLINFSNGFRIERGLTTHQERERRKGEQRWYENWRQWIIYSYYSAGQSRCSVHFPFLIIPYLHILDSLIEHLFLCFKFHN